MSIEEIVKKIPTSIWGNTFESLIDVVLNSPNGDRIPSNLAKTLLYYWQRNQLVTETGLQKLLEAAMMVEPDKTVNALGELGLQEIAATIKEVFKA